MFIQLEQRRYMDSHHTKGSLSRQAARKRPEKYPIFLSAAVYPGSGQIFQRRWLAGIFFGTAFTAMFIAFVIIMSKILVDFYSLGFNFDNAEVSSNPPIAPALLAFGVTMMIYIINIIDTHAAYRKSLIATPRNSYSKSNSQ